MANGTGGRPRVRVRRRWERWAPPDMEFSGCDAFPVTEEELWGPVWAERRYEYWHKASGTAWVSRGGIDACAASPARLVELLRDVALVRGRRIATFGPGDLRIPPPDGAPGDALAPDLAVYAHPGRSRLPDQHVLNPEQHDGPDAVLDVDARNLERYREWGLPEIWVDVPEQGTPGRPPDPGPECGIHRLESGRYRDVEESVAIPGLRAWDIHAILNGRDDVLRMVVARRVGAAWGAAEGASAEDDPLGGWLLDCGRQEGMAQSRIRMADAILRSRGIEFAPEFPDCLPGVSEARIFEAASRAADEADFVDRLLECDTN